jgi:hypothetical protein
VFFPQCERPSFTPTHKAWFASCIKPNKRQQYSGYGFVVFRLREHTINWTLLNFNSNQTIIEITSYNYITL